MAAPGYFVSNGMGGTQQNLSTSLITLTRLVAPASSMKRFYVWEIEVGQNAVPNSTDCPVEYSLNYCSAAGAGTGTAATPVPTSGFLAAGNLDTSVTTAKINFTVEPTTYTTANMLWHKPINQRGSALWQAAPGGEIWFPSVASVGPGIRASSPNYTSTAIATLRFSEI